MLPRKKVAAQFSTFIQFSGDRFHGWLEDPRLRQSMEEQLKVQGASSLSSSDWITHWHQVWKQQSNPRALAHLYAYLQESCYWSSHRLSKRFRSVQLDLSDCFQIAAARTEKIVDGFRPELGIALSTYAGQAFSNAIRDAFSQNQEVQVCSDEALLRRVTCKRLREALQAAGLTEEAVDVNEAVWRSFKTICFPERRRLRRPASLDQNDWVAMATHYEAKRHQRSLPPVDLSQMQARLTACAQHLRRYSSPAALSLNVCLDDGPESFLDKLGAGEMPPLVHLLQEEEKQQQQQRQQQMVKQLERALATLDQPTLMVLTLYYRDRLKQADIAAELDTQQYNISRKISRARQILIHALLQWSASDLHMSADPAVMNNISALLEHWLQLHFSGDHGEHAAV